MKELVYDHHITNVRTWLFNCSPFSVVFYIYCIWINCQNTRSAACGQYPCLMLYFTLIARLKALTVSTVQHFHTNNKLCCKFEIFYIQDFWRIGTSLVITFFFIVCILLHVWSPTNNSSHFLLNYLFAIRAYKRYQIPAIIHVQWR